MGAVTICSDFGAQENKVCHCFHCFPIHLPWSDGLDAMIFIFPMLSFKPAFPLSSFTFIKGSLILFFLPQGWYHWQIWGYWCFSQESWFHASSRPAFCVMYSPYKLNKQGDNIHHWHIIFTIWNQPVVSYPALNIASWPAYRFLRRQVRWSDIPICNNFPQTSFWLCKLQTLFLLSYMFLLLGKSSTVCELRTSRCTSRI